MMSIGPGRLSATLAQLVIAFPLVSAQAADCTILDKLRTSSEIKFRDIRGAHHKYGERFDANFKMDGGDCDIKGAETDDDARYLCTWYVSRGETPARAAYKEMAESTAACMPDIERKVRASSNGRGETSEFRELHRNEVWVSYGYSLHWWYVEFEFSYAAF
jgi:hypothetical protein